MPLTNPASDGSIAINYESRSSNTILGVADSGKTIAITAAITQTFEADETLGDGWWVILVNDAGVGTTVVTLDPDASETIDGATTLHMWPGEKRLVMCNGAGGNFNSIMLHPGTLYVEATSPVTITGTTEGSPTDVISLGAQTYDAVPILLEFHGVITITAASGAINCIPCLWDTTSTQLCRWGDERGTTTATRSCHLTLQLTPSAGSHTYQMRAFKTATSCVVEAGTGAAGSGTYPPHYMKATKV